MAKFVFKLQSVLDLRIQLEENLKLELGKAITELEKEKQILRSIEIQLKETSDQFTARSVQGITVDKCIEFNSYLSFLNTKITRQKENVNQAALNVDKYREQLIKAVQDKEMLERLREKKYRIFRDGEFKTEQKLNDEIVSYKFKTDI